MRSHAASRLLVLSAVVALAGGGAAAAADEPLRWKWSEGDQMRYVSTQTMTMSMDGGPMGKVNSTMNQRMLQAWNVVGVDADGLADLRQSTERIVMKMDGPMGQGFEYDSADNTAPVGMAAMVAPMFDAMVGSEMRMAMTPRGELSEVELSDEFAEKLNQMPGGAASADMITQTAKQAALTFPEEPLEVGDTWTAATEINAPQMGAMTVTVTYRYEGPRDVDGRRLEVFTPSLDMAAANPAMPVSFETKASTGEVLFDREAGRLVSTRLEQQTDVVVSAGGKEIRNAMEQVVEMRVLGPGEAAGFSEGASLAEPAGAAP